MHSYCQFILQDKIKKTVMDDPSSAYNDLENDAIAQVYMQIMDERFLPICLHQNSAFEILMVELKNLSLNAAWLFSINNSNVQVVTPRLM